MSCDLEQPSPLRDDPTLEVVAHLPLLTGGRPYYYHVLQQNIKYNANHGTDRPVYTVKGPRPGGGEQTYHGHMVDVLGHSWAVYDGRRKSCGARLWQETFGPLTVYHRPSLCPDDTN